MFTSVLVANRGEIARRVFATCRRRGLATVAVFSDADAGSPHVREADSAVRLPGVSAADTYLRGDLIIAAALRAGADAIHPGYGFLSESPSFARDVAAAGLTWIGPGPEAIEVMGSKIESKRRMAVAGVPVLDRLDVATITEADLPVLVKASAGGGGRGMRIVRALDDLPEAVTSAAREAASAFGDPTVFCERYLENGHHVEVQIMADGYGMIWALGERECSVQRRHQKVLEEAPSPLVERLGGDLRERLLKAGRDAAAAVGYRGAGTVEFLADERGGFWFLEMNTRLQVEHPVTECVTGVDLVGLQLEVAAGKPLTGPEPAMAGHAIEARLYAEDPAADWRPQTGTIVAFGLPDVTGNFRHDTGEGIRLDAGVEPGSVVGTHYDAMLAKVIAYGKDRETVARRLAAALRRARIHGVTTNRDLLVGSLLHPDFLDGTASTGFYAAHPPASLISDHPHPELAALAAALADAAAERGPLLPGVTSGFRNIPVGYRHRAYLTDKTEISVRYRFGRGGLEVEGADVTLVSATADRVELDVDGVRRTWTIGRFGADDDVRVVVDGPRDSLELRRAPRFTDPSARVPTGALIAPMPGTVVRLGVRTGEVVTAGQPLLWLEAMKMEHVVRSPTAGTVTDLPVQVGRQVTQGTPLAVVTPAGTADG
ncbi:HlyD family efflux transporter periplasmic adaptor subunit [Actinoplanes sp. KI2]|uniref:ATP-binding protein n=1 Tax=Actinoplanes sp. KI2 TaxID=2983315 RepID=UPI0021D5D61E|nr:biotin carboxylase N-terminal domain-containing protein [Actinoplanes sp. KI2]MCU7726842.1 HlyD family efflux transporter periplasmic adaptor subunit [Actinoplanes sp. KI2]